MSNVFDNMLVAPQVTCSQPAQKQQPIKTEQAATPVDKNDELVITSQKENKKGGKISNTIAGIKKFFASISEHSKGIFKGTKNALIGGSVVYTVGTIANKIKGTKNGKPIHSAILGGVVAAGAFALELFKGHLNANEKRSEIEHRWVGH